MADVTGRFVYFIWRCTFQIFFDYTSPMNRVPENRLLGIFESLSVADRSVAKVLVYWYCKPVGGKQSLEVTWPYYSYSQLAKEYLRYFACLLELRNTEILKP